ncbi:agenet domain-containing protein [Pseudoxanthomonas sp. J35]|uniref:agenet domain-containing protein n=1 Tax=Pseudoxanthomonas sp. J35 TaxID=935852 RepID=UPI0004ACDAB1|nr:agenet domain-containing protein [Pseudoxanthomonas sp. J35]
MRQYLLPAAAGLLLAGFHASAADKGQADAGLCSKGKAVSVLYAGTWYPAKVLDGPDRMGTCLVSYDGYGSNWDEWVSAQRMRPAANAAPIPQKPATAAAPATSSKPAAAAGKASPATTAATATGSTAKAPASVPAGKYTCYTFDNGQLNYTYTDVVVQAGNRYSVGKSAGTYSFDAQGRMRFTGPMANATGRFSVKSSGKPQIDLVFNGDARASMTCPKAG